MIAKVRRRSTSVAMGDGGSAPNDVQKGIFMAGVDVAVSVIPFKTGRTR